jgi:hypothetical protein
MIMELPRPISPECIMRGAHELAAQHGEYGGL